jgi:hypothetical protein
MTRDQALDLYFLDARLKLIDLAAFLDRVERCPGDDDFRLRSFQYRNGLSASPCFFTKRSKCYELATVGLRQDRKIGCAPKCRKVKSCCRLWVSLDSAAVTPAKTPVDLIRQNGFLHICHVRCAPAKDRQPFVHAVTSISYYRNVPTPRPHSALPCSKFALTTKQSVEICEGTAAGIVRIKNKGLRAALD